jgi:hypothetical protein
MAPNMVEEHGRFRNRRLGRTWPLAALAAVSALLMGMGGGSGPANEKIVPIPDKNYTVQVTDSRSAKVEARRFTWEGKVYFQGQYGQASAATTSPNLIMAKMTLTTGETLDIALDRSSKCYGETSFGTYEIFVRDVTVLQFE